ncbi:MAG: monooxygenase [Rhizobium sp.]|nr:monooxygenase [Rhizobium sp.]
MKTRISEMFGIDAPIFAFTHCRDVVVEVSKAGGFGVLGMARKSKELVDADLKWIDDHIDGKPYGIDVLMPTNYERTSADQRLDAETLIPPEHMEFVRKMLDDAGIPRLPEQEAEAIRREMLGSKSSTPDDSREMIEIALRHPIRLIVNALGVPPREVVELAHSRGIKVAGLAGDVKHALHQKTAGCDFIVAVGTEAGGHTGSISSMVLWPRIVDAVGSTPVLGAGGVGRGRQVAAALALGCEGVWCGSIWLKTKQSEVLPEIKERLFAARSQDAVLTKTVTGKQCRTLRNKFTEAYDLPGAPTPLKAPLQSILWWSEGRTRVERVRTHDNAKPFLTYPCGQIVGDMTEESSVREVVYGMLSEIADTKERMDSIFA